MNLLRQLKRRFDDWYFSNERLRDDYTWRAVDEDESG